MASAWRSFLRAWEGYRVAADEFRAIDDERVLVLMTALGKGKLSGVDLANVTQRGANVFHVRDDKVTPLMVYFNRERALADLDLKQ